MYGTSQHSFSLRLETQSLDERSPVKSIVVVDVDAPPKEVASLFADPSVNTKWMHDIERYEPVSGKQGMPGSVYRLIPKRGSMFFTATVVKRYPDQLELNLDAENVTVEVHGTMKSLADGRTRLISKENFKFKGVWNRAYGVLARPAIKKAHREHIHAFKKFAEQQRQQRERDATPLRTKDQRPRPKKKTRKQ